MEGRGEVSGSRCSCLSLFPLPFTSHDVFVGEGKMRKKEKYMRATVFRGPFDVRIEQVRDAALQEPTDAVVRITHAAICGSDLWPYRGLEPFQPGGRLGHEWMGMVEEVGSMVTTIKRGDRVIAPFAFSDGTCEFCHKGLYTNCLHGGVWGQANDGGQAEAIRAPFADATLVVVPKSVEGKEVAQPFRSGSQA